MAVSVSIVDVAAYILARENTMVTMKLHKLAFYAQAAHLVRHASPLFPEEVRQSRWPHPQQADG